MSQTSARALDPACPGRCLWVTAGRLLACALAVGAGAGPAVAAGAGGLRAAIGDAWVQVVARGELSSPTENASAGVAREGDVTMRCQVAGLALGARATGAGGGERPRLRAISARWSVSPDTELLLGSLRLHLGAGCLVGDEDWDELEPAQAFTARMLRAATTLSLSSRARPGALARVAAGPVRLAAWAAGPACDADEACALPAHLNRARLEGVAVGIRGLLLAAVRTSAGMARGWARSASASLGDFRNPAIPAPGSEGGGPGAVSGSAGSAAIVVELAGPLVDPGASGADAWEVAPAGWRRALERRVTAIGGRWRAGAHPLLGELEGAFRWCASLSSDAVGCSSDETSCPAATTRGWRLRWGLPGLAGVQPVVALLCQQSEDDDGPALLERSASLDLGAQPWSGLWLRAGFDALAGERLRAGDATGASSQIVRTTTGNLDLEARLNLDEHLACVLRYRQRDTSQSLEAAAQPRQREIIDESEFSAGGAEPDESSAEPAWLRERTGSALWFRTTWSSAGPTRVGHARTGRTHAGLGLAAAPRTASIPALVPARLPPGGASWRPLGAGAHLAEVWCGWGDRAWGVELAARWYSPAGEQPSEVALNLGMSWRPRLAGPADRH